MIAHIETEMRDQPSARGYRMLGDLDSGQSRYEAAADAYRRSVALEPDGETYASLGEAEVMANGGAVTPEARGDFLSALRLEPKDPRGRFYLGLAESEIGDYAKAVAIWRDLEKDSPADAPWLTMLRDHIASFARQGGFDPASIVPAPPTMSVGLAAPAADGRPAMIRSMVEGLAARLEKQPDLDGYLRLAQSYAVLGDAAGAELARSHAAAMIAVMPSGTARAAAQSRLDQLSN
jgi:cytochrome c-type biogenesis protein CcmH